MISTVIATLVFALFAIAAPMDGSHGFKFNARVTSIHRGNAPHEFTVFNPTITSPAPGDMWKMGKTYNATWNISNIPPEKQNATGLILLGYEEDNSENLDIEHPLANNFPLKTGSVPITMPFNIQSRPNYIIVLFGDSGNTSPQFSIIP
ncbi:hypothetical protein AX15_005221 [Amanita polypyramis BW_CC]|nr:hypothetical protein AX15_005221 [Amanita polypyramis BW_CC]